MPLTTCRHYKKGAPFTLERFMSTREQDRSLKRQLHKNNFIKPAKGQTHRGARRKDREKIREEREKRKEAGEERIEKKRDERRENRRETG